MPFAKALQTTADGTLNKHMKQSLAFKAAYLLYKKTQTACFLTSKKVTYPHTLSTLVKKQLPGENYLLMSENKAKVPEQA